MIDREPPDPTLAWPQYAYEIVDLVGLLSFSARGSSVSGLLYRAKEILLQQLVVCWLEKGCKPTNLVRYHFDRGLNPSCLVIHCRNRHNKRQLFHLRPGEEEKLPFTEALAAVDQIKARNQKNNRCTPNKA